MKMTRIIRRHRDACERSAVSVLRNASVTSYPVPVETIAEHLGINLQKEPMIDDLSGMCFYSNGTPIIVVNAKHSPNRQNFTIAHEIGHVVLHQSELRKKAFVDKKITVLHRDGKASSGKYQAEIEANQFAAALLMPKQLIHRYMKENNLSYGLRDDDDAVSKMAEAFGVSTTALAIRLGRVIS